MCSVHSAYHPLKTPFVCLFSSNTVKSFLILFFLSLILIQLRCKSHLLYHPNYATALLKLFQCYLISFKYLTMTTKQSLCILPIPNYLVTGIHDMLSPTLFSIVTLGYSLSFIHMTHSFIFDPYCWFLPASETLFHASVFYFLQILLKCHFLIKGYFHHPV